MYIWERLSSTATGTWCRENTQQKIPETGVDHRTCSVRNWVYIWERLSSASSWLNLAWSSAACCGCKK